MNQRLSKGIRWASLATMLLMPTFASFAQAKTANTIYTANASDNDLNNDRNWSGPLGTHSRLFFRGDNVTSSGLVEVELTDAITVTEVLFQPSPGARYRIFGEKLTIDETPDEDPFLVTMFASLVERQVFDNRVVLLTKTDANREHIRTGGRGSELVFSGGLVQHPASKGLGIHLRAGDFVLAAEYDDKRKLTKIHGTAGGGRFIVRGKGLWKGKGNLQIASGATVVLQSERTDGLSFAPRGVQLMDATLQLRGHQQIAAHTSVQFASDGANLLSLDGHEVAINKLSFPSYGGQGVLDLGEGGVLRLLGQDPNESWGHLRVRGWSPDSGQILIEGGLLSPMQLKEITFEGYVAGARVRNGQLLPAGK